MRAPPHSARCDPEHRIAVEFDAATAEGKPVRRPRHPPAVYQTANLVTRSPQGTPVCLASVKPRVCAPYRSRKLHLSCRASGVSEANMVDDDLDLNPTADSGQTANPVGQRTQPAADIAHGAEGGFD